MTLREAWTAYWQRLARRERVLLATAAALLAGAGAYVLLYEPMVRDLEASEAALSRTRGSAFAARRGADEVAGLARATPATPTADTRSAVEHIVALKGLGGLLTALEAKDGSVRVTFADIGLDTFAAFVEAAGREEQLFASEALLTARVTPGRVRAEATLVRAPRR